MLEKKTKRGVTWVAGSIGAYDNNSGAATPPKGMSGNRFPV